MQGPPIPPPRESAPSHLGHHESLENQPFNIKMTSSSSVKVKGKNSARGVKSSIYLPIMEEEESKEVKGMENPTGYNNCFINVVIQSLWHLGSFRHRFLEDEAHEHRNEKEELEIKYSVIKMHHSQRIKRYQSMSIPYNKEAITHSIYEERQPQSARTQSFYERQKSEKSEKSQQTVNEAKEKCLLCNLRELFQEYRDQGKENLLQPAKVRESLLFVSMSQDHGFQLGHMGQPQEVFDDILSYIHREAIFPKFTENLMLERGGFDNDDNFKLLNDFDNFPCHPPCPAHRCFSFELCDQGMCLSCKMTHPETVKNVTVENNIRLYVGQFNEFISLIKSQRLEQTITLEDIIFYHYKNNLTAMKKTKFSHKCSCKGKYAAYQKWCIEVPTILTILLEWPPSIVMGQDPKESAIQMQRLLKMITPVIDIRAFLNVGLKKIDSMNNYVLRGFITYYGRHYIAYFYLERRDVWVKFDDDVIKEIGSFTDVEERILRGREMIVQIFYESQLFIENVIAQQSAMKQYNAEIGSQYAYFSKKGRKNNKFYRGKNSDKSCEVF